MQTHNIIHLLEKKNCVCISKAENAPKFVIICKIQWALETASGATSIRGTLTNLSASCPSSLFLSLIQKSSPGSWKQLLSSPPAQYKLRFISLPPERKAISESGQWYLGCWARQYEFCWSGAHGSLGHSRSAGPTCCPCCKAGPMVATLGIHNVYKRRKKELLDLE